MALSPDSCGIVADFGTWLAQAEPSGPGDRDPREAERIVDVLGTLLDLRVACLHAEDHTRWRTRDLDALLDTLVPAHVALPRDDTVDLVVPAVRLFLDFLDARGRVHPDSDDPAALAAVLAGHEGELAARMADSARWGAAKRLFLAGYATGPGRGRALPAIRLPDEVELARAAALAPSFAAAITLAGWVGAGRPVTATGVLRLAPAGEATRLLGIGALPAGTRSARDVESLHHVWSIACAAGLIVVGRWAATSAPLVRALAGGRSPEVLRAWAGMWEGVASGSIGGGPVAPASRHGDVTRELLRELYDHAGRWVPMGSLFELLSHAPDGRPRAPLGADPALFTGMLLAQRMDDLRAFGVLEIRELVGGGEPFMAVRLTPLGLYGLRARFLELGVPAPIAGPGGEVEPSLPPLYVPPRTECALAARMSPLLAQAAALAEYVEEHGPPRITAEDVLEPDVARLVADDLDIAHPPPNRRGASTGTARDLHALHRRWTLALATGFLYLADGRVHVADSLRVWREGTDAELVALAARAMVVVAEDNATFGEAHATRWDMPEGLAASLFTGLVQLGGPLPVSLFVGLAVRCDLEHVVRTLPVEPPADDEAFALGRILDAPDLVHEMAQLCDTGTGTDTAGASPPAGDPSADALRRVRAGLILLADRLAALGVVRRTAEGITLTGLGGALVHRMFCEQSLPVATVDDYTPTSGTRLLAAMGGWPRPIATRAFAAWIECRPVPAALSELCAAAGAAGPTERLMLFAHLGHTTLPASVIEAALAEAAADPTLAPHVWNWRLTHDHDVPPATLRTLAWLTADNAAAALLGRHEAAVLGLLTEVTGGQGPGADVIFGELATMGHPYAEDVLRFAESSHPDPKVARAARRALHRLR